jgi:hypothetical protein
MMRYKILKDASLRESMRKYKEKGDERWMLFDALIRSTSKDEYMAKVRDFEKEITSRKTGKAWKVTPENCFQYVLNNGRIGLIP